MDEATWRARAAAMARASGASDRAVLRALGSVPRHTFVPAASLAAAYDDEPLPITDGDSTISAPHMVAIQLESARLLDGLSVLEVGSGSGYLLALVSEVMHRTGRVLGLEVDVALADRARETLTTLGYPESVEVRAGDGWDGLAERAPFDRILVSCAVPGISPAWRAQLRRGGRIVAPVGDRRVQRLLTYGDGADPIETGPACRFVAVRRPGPHI